MNRPETAAGTDKLLLLADKGINVWHVATPIRAIAVGGKLGENSAPCLWGSKRHTGSNQAALGLANDFDEVERPGVGTFAPAVCLPTVRKIPGSDAH
jgi:hypothetical protein